MEQSHGKTGRDFEKDIEATFKSYAQGHIARMDMMPTPTRQVGMRNGVPVLVRSGKPPFDVYGYRVADGVMIGAELKASSRKNALPIVPPNRRGDGLQFHQLDALASLARCGGVARLVWNNGGEVGVLCSQDIMTTASAYEHTIRTMMSGKHPQKGSRSIPWERFTLVDYKLYSVVGIDWLMADKK